ncbi:hypothetical protein BvCmsKKP041_05185 [Escherichia coli]|nr:hypothetical protein BvCmsKKP041_05185 [Escherichia coli]
MPAGKPLQSPRTRAVHWLPVLLQLSPAQTAWGISPWEMAWQITSFWKMAVVWMYWRAIQPGKPWWMTAVPWQCLPVVRQQMSPLHPVVP